MDNFTALTAGPKDRRVEVTMTTLMDAAISAMAARLGEGDGAHLRSEALRQLVAAGVAANPGLINEAQAVTKTGEFLLRAKGRRKSQ